MRLNLDMAQVQSMGEGVLLLDRQAQVKAYNPAAVGWLQECVALSDDLRALIKSDRAGQTTLPAPIQLNGTWGEHAPSRVAAWLCKDGRADYALFIARPTPEQEFKSNETRFVSLVGAETRKAMAQLSELLRQAGEPDREAIARQSARVDGLLLEIEQLATLFQRDKLFLADRLSVTALLKEILPGLPQQSGKQAISYKLLEAEDAQGIVYGDAEWLKYAIHNLLAALGASAPAHSEVILKLRQLGDFLVINGRVHSTPQSRSISSQPRSEDDNAPLERDIRLQMCRRIVELHGGHLKTSSAGPGEADTGIEFITLELLTGMPEADRSLASCAQCRYTLQAQAYAQDLSALLADQA